MSHFGGIGRAFSSRNYRLYWLGNAVSIVSFWIYTVALGWFVWQLTKSELWLGLVPFAARVPALILAPLAGAVADRFGLVRTAVVALFISACGSTVLYIAVILGLEDPRWILFFALIQGVTVSFELPSRQALLPSLLNERDDLSAAIAVNTTTFQSGAFVGPMLFALLIQVADLSVAFLINAIGFFLFTAIMLILKVEREPARRSGSGMWTDITDGFRYVRGHSGILGVMMAVFVAHLIIRPYVDLLPAFADVVFGRAETGLAILQSAAGGGALLGGVILAARGRTRGQTRLFIAALLASYMAYMAFAASTVFAVGTALMFLTGLMLIGVIVSSQTLIQNAVEQQVRGRVISLTTGMAVGVPSLGALLLGWLATIFGIQTVVAAGCAVGILFWLVMVPRVARQTAVLEADVRPPAAA